MKYNRLRSKILVRFKITNPETDEEEECFRYVPYPRKKRNPLIRRKKQLARKYGYGNYREFWEEVEQLAFQDGFGTPWEFVNQGHLDDYFYRVEKIKKS